MKFEMGIGSKIALIIFWLSEFVTGLTICMVYGWQLTLFMCLLLPLAAIVSGVTTRVSIQYDFC
jgi:ABC-type multidrug transport system fused ATPase/permease subunit